MVAGEVSAIEGSDDDTGALTVVVDDVHVNYRVWAAPDASGRPWWRRRRPAMPAMREVRALRGVSFIARQGESIGIIGRNGSGKSTLMRAIAGLIPPDRGTVYAQGQPTLLGVGSVLVSGLSGRRNVELGLLALGLSPAEIATKADDIITFSGIGSAIDMPMKTYSSGMGARLKFAIASAVERDILLIDEALATGDSEFVERSSQRIDELREEAETIFLVSHSMGSIRRACDRVIWLEDGRIRMDGPVDDVLPLYEATVPMSEKKLRKMKRKERRLRDEERLMQSEGRSETE